MVKIFKSLIYGTKKSNFGVCKKSKNLSDIYKNIIVKMVGPQQKEQY